MSKAATATGTPRRRQMELDQLARIAQRDHPTLAAAMPGPVFRRRLERLHHDLATGKVVPTADAV